MLIGERIVKLREKRGWNQRELARRAGLNFSVMNRIETGKRAVTDQEIKVFADLFEVSTDFLLGRTDNSNTQANDEKEMKEFFSNPELNLFFREMKESPEEQLEELREIWEVIKKRNKK